MWYSWYFVCMYPQAFQTRVLLNGILFIGHATREVGKGKPEVAIHSKISSWNNTGKINFILFFFPLTS